MAVIHPLTIFALLFTDCCTNRRLILRCTSAEVAEFTVAGVPVGEAVSIGWVGVGMTTSQTRAIVMATRLATTPASFAQNATLGEVAASEGTYC
jgi:hypothetical protein